MITVVTKIKKETHGIIGPSMPWIFHTTKFRIKFFIKTLATCRVNELIKGEAPNGVKFMFYRRSVVLMSSLVFTVNYICKLKNSYHSPV